MGQQLLHRDAPSVFVLIVPGGKLVLTSQHPDCGTEARLIPEQSFERVKSIRIISYTQVPDITVEVHRPGALPQLYLFDPKYKLSNEPEDRNTADGRSTKVDTEKIHTYRDAIRYADERQVVVFAATLYPGHAQRHRSGLEQS